MANSADPATRRHLAGRGPHRHERGLRQLYARYPACSACGSATVFRCSERYVMALSGPWPHDGTNTPRVEAIFSIAPPRGSLRNGRLERVHFGLIDTRELCIAPARSASGQDCAGDSGGPVMVKVFGRWWLARTISRGRHAPPADTGTASTTPANRLSKSSADVTS